MLLARRWRSHVGLLPLAGFACAGVVALSGCGKGGRPASPAAAVPSAAAGSPRSVSLGVLRRPFGRRDRLPAEVVKLMDKGSALRARDVRFLNRLGGADFYLWVPGGLRASLPADEQVLILEWQRAEGSYGYGSSGLAHLIGSYQFGSDGPKGHALRIQMLPDGYRTASFRGRGVAHATPIDNNALVVELRDEATVTVKGPGTRPRSIDFSDPHAD